MMQYILKLAFGNIISDAFKTPTLQIVVMGSGGVGKSAITNRFVNKSFADEWNPTIEDFYTQTVTLEENGVQSRHQVEIIDTAGQVCASFACSCFNFGVSMFLKWLRFVNFSGPVQGYDQQVLQNR